MLSNFIVAILLIAIIILAILCTKLYKKVSMLSTSSKDGISNVQKSIDVIQDDNISEIKNEQDTAIASEIDNLKKANIYLSEENNKLKNEIDDYKETIKNIKIAASSYSDKTLKSICLLVNGIKHGEERVYFKGSSSLNKIKNWNKGILDGNSVTFYKTGEKYIKTNYKNNKLNGNYIVYNKDGSIKESCLYENGVKNE